MSMLLHTALSLESEEVAMPQDDTAAELELETVDGEIAGADREMERAEMEQEELEAAAETLESIQVSLESAIADDSGLTRREAQAYQTAYKAAIGTALPSPILSLESFGGDSERLQATQMSLEGVGDTLKKLWEAIKRAVANAMRAVSDFFAKLFGGAKKLRERAEEVLKKLEEKKAAKEELEGGKLKAPKGLDRIHVKGGVQVSDIKGGVSLVKTNVIAGLADVVNGAEGFYKTLAASIKNRKEAKAAMTAALDSTGYEKAVGKITSYTQPLPGGKQLRATITGGEDDKTETVSVPKIKLVDTPNNRTPKEADITGVKLDDLIAMAKEAVALAKGIEDSKKTRENLSKQRQEVVKETEGLAKDAEKLIEKAEGTWTQVKISAALRLANMDLNTAISRVDAYVFGYVRGLVQFLDGAAGEFKKPA